MHIRVEILSMQTSLLTMRTSQQPNLPVAAAQPQLAAHGIHPDATITAAMGIIPSPRQNIRREDTILCDAMDIL